MLVPELSFNPSHNLSGTRIELFLDSKKSSTVIWERKQTGLTRGLGIKYPYQEVQFGYEAAKTVS